VDDHSDYTRKQLGQLSRLLTDHLFIRNTSRQFSVKNAFAAIHSHVPDNAIVVNVDGDDWLPHPQVLKEISRLYQSTECWLSYGGCEYYLGERKEIAQLPLPQKNAANRYDSDCEQKKLYRSSFFLPIHLRTWRSALFKKIKEKDLKRPDGSWLQFCEDQAFFLPMLEMAAGKYEVTTSPLYVYNLSTPFSDHLKYRKEKLLDELCIRSKRKYESIKYL
jgi:hypothetical protein